jgi:hypothetical protein
MAVDIPNLTPNLGTPLARFQPHWRAYALTFGIFLLLLGAGIAVLFTSDRGKGFLLIGLASVLLVMYSVAILRLDGARRIMIFEEGLVDQHGSTVTVIRWGDVIWLRSTTSQWLSSRLQIGLRDGTTHTLRVAIDHAIPDTAESQVPTTSLADMIEGVLSFVAPDLLIFLQQRYDGGYDLDFGPLMLNQQGLRVKTTFVPWTDVADIDIHGDDLMIMRNGVRGIWQRLSYNDLRNPFLLHAILVHAQGERFSMQHHPGESGAVRTWLARRRVIRMASTITVFALPFVLIFGWFAWEYHDWSTNPNRHSAAGYACLTRNAPAKALPNFERALAINPDHAPARCGRGAALIRLNQPTTARADLERCRTTTSDPALRTFATQELRRLRGQ